MADEELVPDSVIPHQHLPPLRYRDLPEPIPWTRMVGPSIILAGMALGSGEYILWPYIVSRTEFVFFWACLLGVVTQFFLNMEIERWTLATGESTITGFCRLSRQWAWIMLILTIVPWAWPGWATGAGEILIWLLYGPVERTVTAADGTASVVYEAKYTVPFAVAGLVLTGVILTSGPVVYNTVEKIQGVLVIAILVAVVALAVMVIRPAAVVEMAKGSIRLGTVPELEGTGLDLMTLLGALAFAGAGGTLNLGQSNYIKDKGYGMGAYIGRITSPLTGQEEPVAEVGYHFPHTPDNLARWQRWWRAANIEHFFSFLMTCLICLCLLSLIAHSLLYDEPGRLKPGMEAFGKGMNFVWAEATALAAMPQGYWMKPVFLLVGVAVLLTTELGVLDAVARIATDIVKVNYLRDRPDWTASRLYFVFLWTEILLGSAILVAGLKEPLRLLTIAAASNGAVMFLYSLILLYMNSKILSRRLSISPVRFVALVWSCAFFGYFTFQALRNLITA